MPKCSLCPRSQSALNPGNLCKECFKKPKFDDWASSLTSDQVDELPALPDDWQNKSLKDLTAGHLIRLMFGLYAPVQNELKKLNESITELQNVNKAMSIKIKIK